MDAARTSTFNSNSSLPLGGPSDQEMVVTRKIPDPAQHGGRPYASSCTLVRRESFRNPTCPTTPGPRSRRAPPRNPAVGCAFQLLGLPRGSPISESRRRSGGHEYAPPRLQRRRQLSPRPSWRPREEITAMDAARTSTFNSNSSLPLGGAPSQEMVGTDARKIPHPAQDGGRPPASFCTLVRRESFRNPMCPTTPGLWSSRNSPRLRG